MTPVGVGFVGAGSVLWAYLQQLDRLVPRGVAQEGPICARRSECWPALLRRRPGAQLVSEARGVVESPDVDVVVVITPPDSHAELARLALEHGKHVLVEKPLALSRRSAEDLAVLAADVGRHLVAAPFVHLAPIFRLLWTLVEDGALGHVHSARGLYGNPGATWAAWYYTTGVGTLAEMGIYNLKSLAALVGAVQEVVAVEATAVPTRTVGRIEIPAQEADVSHVVLRHRSGAVSSVVSSAAIQRYRRPGLELYGTQGTANLLGDDWDPRGVEVWRNELGRWEQHEPIDATWLWTDGLRELVEAVAEDREPLAAIEQDLHLLDVVDAARAAAAGGRPTAVASGFPPLDLRLELPSDVHHVHDRTRPIGEQL